MFDFSGDFVKKEEPGGGSGDEFVPPTPTKAMGSPTKKTRKAGTYVSPVLPSLFPKF